MHKAALKAATGLGYIPQKSQCVQEVRLSRRIGSDNEYSIRKGKRATSIDRKFRQFFRTNREISMQAF